MEISWIMCDSGVKTNLNWNRFIPWALWQNSKVRWVRVTHNSLWLDFLSQGGAEDKLTQTYWTICRYDHLNSLQTSLIFTSVPLFFLISCQITSNNQGQILRCNKNDCKKKKKKHFPRNKSAPQFSTFTSFHKKSNFYGIWNALRKMSVANRNRYLS